MSLLPNGYSCPCCQSGEDQMSTYLKVRFARLRIIYGEDNRRPLRIKSGFRCKRHNDRVGGGKSSGHLRGHAVDIFCYAAGNRFQIIKSALEAGFSRIGISRAHIHLSADPNKLSGVIWQD